MSRLDNKIVGKRIQDRRKSMRIRQDEVAEATGIKKNTLSAIENGHHNIDLENFVNICNALRTNPMSIIGDYVDVKE